MKIILILLAVVASSVTVEESPFANHSIASKIIDFIKDFRNRMPYGFPKWGIPPLAPLKISHQDINIDTPILQLKGSVDNVTVNRLNEFEIFDVTNYIFLSRVDFRFVLKNVDFDTFYDLNMLLKKDGITTNMVGKSPAKFAIKDVVISGNSKYSVNLWPFKYTVKSLRARIHINEVKSQIVGIPGEGEINQKMNEMLAEAIKTGVNENEKLITDIIEDIGLPILKKHLNLYD